MMDAMIIVDQKKEISYCVKWEDDISWRLQNKIHRLLNESYESVSSSFISKTYSKSLPHQRILLFIKNKLIGHLALFKRYLMAESNKIPFIGMGLIAVQKSTPGYGLALLKWGLEEAKSQNVDFASGITNNLVVKKMAEQYGAKIYQSKLMADNEDTTKENDVVMFFPLQNKKNVMAYLNKANIDSVFKITGGPVF